MTPKLNEPVQSSKSAFSPRDYYYVKELLRQAHVLEIRSRDLVDRTRELMHKPPRTHVRYQVRARLEEPALSSISGFRLIYSGSERCTWPKNARTFEARLTRLKELYKAVSFQQELLRPNLYGALESYGAPSCRAICEDLQHKLPRELRDLVYHFILEEDSHLYARLHDGNLQPIPEQGPNPDMSSNIKLHPLASSFFSNYIFLGHVTTRELIEYWCAKTNFTIDTKDLHILPLLPNQGDLGHGLCARKLIRNVTLILQPHIWESTRTHHDEDFEHLFALRSGAMISILICDSHYVAATIAYNGIGRLDNSIQSLSVVFPVLSRLKASGYKVMIKMIHPEIDFSDVELTKEAWILEFK